MNKVTIQPTFHGSNNIAHWELTKRFRFNCYKDLEIEITMYRLRYKTIHKYFVWNTKRIFYPEIKTEWVHERNFWVFEKSEIFTCEH